MIIFKRGGGVQSDSEGGTEASLSAGGGEKNKTTKQPASGWEKVELGGIGGTEGKTCFTCTRVLTQVAPRGASGESGLASSLRANCCNNKRWRDALPRTSPGHVLGQQKKLPKTHRVIHLTAAPPPDPTPLRLIPIVGHRGQAKWRAARSVERC